MGTEKKVIVKDGFTTCSKCGRLLKDTNFYTHKDGSKAGMCKACMTLHVNNTNPETFLWILKDFDVPYIETEWRSLYERAYLKDPYKITGMTVLGKYLSKMKLNQFKDYTFEDSDALNAAAGEKEKERREAAAAKLEEVKQQYEEGTISEAQYQTYCSTVEDIVRDREMAEDKEEEENQPSPRPLLPSIEDQLTPEDIVYLTLKWGDSYSAEEWVQLERKYNEFKASYEVMGASREDQLLMICKTSLKMNAAIDSNDIESYQKLSRVYDTLCKAAKFNESQIKDQTKEDIGSVGEIVYLCEKEKGRIPDWDLHEDKDIVDTLIRDTQSYLTNLIYNDPNMGQQLENFLRRNENQEVKKIEELGERANQDKTHYAEMEDDDYVEFLERMNATDTEDFWQ